ncbi:hypothetical protein L596_003967 [Steinernema carpocapsae]|uniref:Uncharacterized protein n=1 Tax=Steinernema carpocapsae TaxID=34508 RepID=A0A4U8UU46_STECR|nr:hypothetical protein L596_003967 [Steinernema carpocapsae]
MLRVSGFYSTAADPRAKFDALPVQKASSAERVSCFLDVNVSIHCSAVERGSFINLFSRVLLKRLRIGRSGVAFSLYLPAVLNRDIDWTLAEGSRGSITDSN